jgi:hypothetical protein
MGCGGNCLNLGIILAAISIIIVIGPIASAVIMYKDNLIALVMPDIEKLTDYIEDYLPTVEFVGYEIIDPESSFRVMFNVTNNSDEDLTFNALNFSAYCSQHDEALLGCGYGEDFPLTIYGRSSAILSLYVTFTEEGQTHIETHHGGDTNFHAILKDVLVVVQGVKVELGDKIDVGPIEIPP